MNKAAQVVAPVQPQAASATGTVPPTPSPLQPAGAPVTASVPTTGVKSTSGTSMTSSGEPDKLSGIKRASILSVLYKHGAYVQKDTKNAPSFARRNQLAKKGKLLKAAATVLVARRRELSKAAAGPFFQSRGTDTLRLARYLGERFNINALKGMSAGKLTAAGPDKVNREQRLLSMIGAGATGAAGLGAAGLGYGAYKALGGGGEE